jgi:hypothetical protein
MGWLVAMLQILDNLRNLSRGRLPPRQPGWALEGEQADGTGNDLMPVGARKGARTSCTAGHRVIGRARRPPPARRVHVNPRVTG